MKNFLLRLIVFLVLSIQNFVFGQEILKSHSLELPYRISRLSNARFEPFKNGQGFIFTYGIFVVDDLYNPQKKFVKNVIEGVFENVPTSVDGGKSFYIHTNEGVSLVRQDDPTNAQPLFRFFNRFNMNLHSFSESSETYLFGAPLLYKLKNDGKNSLVQSFEVAFRDQSPYIERPQLYSLDRGQTLVSVGRKFVEQFDTATQKLTTLHNSGDDFYFDYRMSALPKSEMLIMQLLRSTHEGFGYTPRIAIIRRDSFKTYDVLGPYREKAVDQNSYVMPTSNEFRNLPQIDDAYAKFVEFSSNYSYASYRPKLEENRFHPNNFGSFIIERPQDKLVVYATNLSERLGTLAENKEYSDDIFNKSYVKITPDSVDYIQNLAYLGLSHQSDWYWYSDASGSGFMRLGDSKKQEVFNLPLVTSSLSMDKSYTWLQFLGKLPFKNAVKVDGENFSVALYNNQSEKIEKVYYFQLQKDFYPSKYDQKSAFFLTRRYISIAEGEYLDLAYVTPANYKIIHQCYLEHITKKQAYRSTTLLIKAVETPTWTGVMCKFLNSKSTPFALISRRTQKVIKPKIGFNFETIVSFGDRFIFYNGDDGFLTAFDSKTEKTISTKKGTYAGTLQSLGGNVLVGWGDKHGPEVFPLDNTTNIDFYYLQNFLKE